MEIKGATLFRCPILTEPVRLFTVYGMVIVKIFYNSAIFINIYVDRDVDVTVTLCVWIISYIYRIVRSVSVLVSYILTYVVKPFITVSSATVVGNTLRTRVNMRAQTRTCLLVVVIVEYMGSP